jgi:hypothetical protein
MVMFSMFVAQSPSDSPINIYSENQAFGPFGEAAGEVSTVSGFSEILWLDLAQSAAESFRALRLVCNGSIRVAGTQKGFPVADPTSPLVVELVPAPNEMRELARLCLANHIETPRQIFYHGVDPASLMANVELYFNGESSLQLKLIDPTGAVQKSVDLPSMGTEFLAGRLSIPTVEATLAPGRPLGNVSDKNLSAGLYKFGIEIRTTPPVAPSLADPFPSSNYLDPVVLFNMLGSAKLTNGADAIAPAELPRSWLQNVRKDRVLITFRDEWNAALVSPGLNAAIRGSGVSQAVIRPLSDVQVGTVVAPTGWAQYTCELGGPARRRLTPIPSDLGAADTVALTATAPAHLVVGSVRPEDWFQGPDPPFDPSLFSAFDLPLFTDGNVATPLIDGFAYFDALARDMKELNDPSPPTTPFDGHFYPENFVLLADFLADFGFPLIPNDPSTNVISLLTNGAQSTHRLIIRALVWYGDNDSIDQVSSIDDLDSEHYITEFVPDALGVPLITWFHWKCCVVRNKKGTFAHLGGIDLGRNRLDGPDHLPPNWLSSNGRGYHDVQLRLQGPAVADVTKAFVDRYNEVGIGSDVTDSIRPTVTTPVGVPATHMVQIARTFQPQSEFGGQRWSPQGDRQIWATLKQAIRRARRYIYIEDQYMIAPMVRDELLAALQTKLFLEVILVFPEKCEDFKHLADQTAYDRARYLFIKDLIVNPKVVALYVPSDKYFVHAKVKIVDDVFVQIGSSNLNSRSLTHDAELDAFVLDGRVEGGARKFARDFRTKLWAEHLGMPLTSASFGRLNDVNRAIDLMRHTPRTSRMWPYSVKNPGSSYTTLWSKVDPVSM